MLLNSKLELIQWSVYIFTYKVINDLLIIYEVLFAVHNIVIRIRNKRLKP